MTYVSLRLRKFPINCKIFKTWKQNYSEELQRLERYTGFSHKPAMCFGIILATGITPSSLTSSMQMFTVSAWVPEMGGAPNAGDSFLPYCISGEVDW